MNFIEDASALRERIEAFQLDDPESSLPFTSRLAREQAWTHAFAARVVFEYRRFLYLAMTADHPVTPSEEVDQAWHLHLVYTKNYWHVLCRDILGKELHHQPTLGGQDEGEKFTDWYSRTLASYRAVFHQCPPQDIWPEPELRFAAAGQARWVDVSQFWLLPRPAIFRLACWNTGLRKIFTIR